MKSLYFQCIYNDEEKCWIICAADGLSVPRQALQVFQQGIKGVGETLEQAIGDWKESMLLSSLAAHESQQNSNP